MDFYKMTPTQVQKIIDRCKQPLTDEKLRQFKRQASMNPYKKKPHGIPEPEQAQEVYPLLAAAYPHIKSLNTLADHLEVVEVLDAIRHLMLDRNNRSRQSDEVTRLKENRSLLEMKKKELRLSVENDAELLKLRKKFKEAGSKESMFTIEEYRTLAQQIHPDRGGDNEAMAILNSKYDKNTARIARDFDERYDIVKTEEKKKTKVIKKQLKKIKKDIEAAENGMYKQAIQIMEEFNKQN